MNEQERDTRVMPGGSLSDLALLLARRWRLVIGLTTLFTVSALAVSLSLPKWYEAEVRMLPPKRGGMGGLSIAPSSAAMSAADLLGIMGGGGTEPALLANILQSRTVSDAIIERFKLRERYQQETMEEARMALWGHASIDIERKSSVISVKVEDKSPTMARDVASAIAEEGNRLNNKISNTRASQERRFLEGRLIESRRDLEKAEVALKEFSVKNKMLDVKEQTKAAIQTVARVRGELMAREVMLSYLSSFAGDAEENKARLNRESAELKRQLARAESGGPPSGISAKEGSGSVVTPITELPALALEYTRLYRELKIQETVFELLTKQFEMAKLGEASDTANAQIIDGALVPTRKVRPKRANFVVFGFLAGFVLSLGIARFRERLAHDPGTATKWRAVGDALRGRDKPVRG